MEIKVKVNSAWLDEKCGGGERVIVNRFATAILGNNKHVYEKDSGYKWGLDAGNDWWAEAQDPYHPEIWTIAYRYGRDEIMDAFQITLTWLMR